MTTTAPSAAVSVHRTRYEGANIRTWIGFKHFMYLVEDALLDWLRRFTPGARQLYHEHGLGFEIVDCSVLLPAVLEVDDEVRAYVTPYEPGRFRVRLHAVRDGHEAPVARANVVVALVHEPTAPASRSLDGVAGAEWLPGPVPELPSDAAEEAVPADGFRWSWRAPYFYCHFSDRVQHSGFVRALEEVVDLFLADRGISVRHMLTERGWIPVVSRARVRLLGATHMEEVVHTTFRVDEILRGTMFDGRMLCRVERNGRMVPVAAGRILHGYAVSRGREAGQLASLDDSTIAALTGRGAP